jgi:hypothetical protein
MNQQDKNPKTNFQTQNPDKINKRKPQKLTSKSKINQNPDKMSMRKPQKTDLQIQPTKNQKAKTTTKI